MITSKMKGVNSMAALAAFDRKWRNNGKVVASTPTEGGGHPLGRGANSPLAQGPTTRRSRDRLPSAPQGHSGGLQPLGPRPRGLQPLGPRPRRPTQRGWPSGKAGGGHSDARRARLSPGGCLQPPGGCLQPPDRLARPQQNLGDTKNRVELE